MAEIERAELWHEWRGNHRAARKKSRVTITSDDDGGFAIDELMRFVLRARIDLLMERVFDPALDRWVPAAGKELLKQSTLGSRLGYHSGSSLSKFVNESAMRTRPYKRDDLLDLELRLLLFAYQYRHATRAAVRGFGWLTSFWDELVDTERRRRAVVDVAKRAADMLHRQDTPNTMLARWHADLCEAGPHNSAEALVIGEAFLELLRAVRRPEAATAIWTQHADDATRTVRAQVAVATRPTNRGATPAIRTAALLGHRVFDAVDEHLARSAVGFRATRIVTRVLYLARTHPPAWWPDNGRTEIDRAWKTLEFIAGHADHPDEIQRLPDPYPARSFFVEALREAVKTARVMEDPVREARALTLLRERFENHSGTRPTRERMYAAYCLFELEPGQRSQLTARLSSWGNQHPDERAWTYLASMFEHLQDRPLEQLLIEDVGAWSRSAHRPPELDVVLRHRATAGRTDDPDVLPFLDRLPVAVQQGTRRLIRYAQLSPDGTMRRRACETLREAGVTTEAAGIVAETVADPLAPRWLREHSAFILGVLADPIALPVLHAAAGDPDLDATIRHAALWALGDVQSRDPQTISLLLDLLRKDPDNLPAPVAHAATYALAVLPPDDTDTAYAKDQEDLLIRLARDDFAYDRTSMKLADWGVRSFTRSHKRRAHVKETEILGLAPLPD